MLGFALVFFAAIVAGFLMPSKFSVERAEVIPAPPGDVFARFATPRTWPEWSAWSTTADSTLRCTFEGPASGVGATMKWTARQMGNGTLRIIEAIEPSSVRYEVRIADTPVVVNGLVTLEPAGAGTKVTWRDAGDVGRNPIMRLLLPMIDGSLGNAFEIGFRGLRRTLAEAAPDSAAGSAGS